MEGQTPEDATFRGFATDLKLDMAAYDRAYDNAGTLARIREDHADGKALGVTGTPEFFIWFWVGLQTGVTLGVLFAHWMIFQSLYRLGALCPYCMVVWAVTTPIFWYTTLHNVRAGHLPVPAPTRRAVNAVANYHGAVLTGWFILLVALILKQFWTYWSGLVS